MWTYEFLDGQINHGGNTSYTQQMLAAAPYPLPEKWVLWLRVPPRRGLSTSTQYELAHTWDRGVLDTILLPYVMAGDLQSMADKGDADKICVAVPGEGTGWYVAVRPSRVKGPDLGNLLRAMKE